MPVWLPPSVRAYLAHTEDGTSIRALARRSGLHPSTILRQVRRTETLRDDPLADAALTRLGRILRQATASGPNTVSHTGEMLPMIASNDNEARLARDGMRALRALLEPETILVIADGVEDAVVVRNSGDGRPLIIVTPMRPWLRWPHTCSSACWARHRPWMRRP